MYTYTYIYLCAYICICIHVKIHDGARTLAVANSKPNVGVAIALRPGKACYIPIKHEIVTNGTGVLTEGYARLPCHMV